MDASNKRKHAGLPAKYVIAAWLEEIAANVAAFKSSSGMNYALGRVDRLATDYLDRRKAHFRVVLRQIIGSLALQAIASAALSRLPPEGSTKARYLTPDMNGMSPRSCMAASMFSAEYNPMTSSRQRESYSADALA